jgi:hypothetical protein
MICEQCTRQNAGTAGQQISPPKLRAPKISTLRPGTTLDDFTHALVNSLPRQGTVFLRRRPLYYPKSIMRVLNSAPVLDEFIPLDEHQSQTPGTFFGGKPVLYFHGSATLQVDEEQVRKCEEIANVVEGTSANTETNGDSVPKKITTNVDLWVSSE